MKTIKESDTIALLKDLPSHHLEKGDVGTVVQILDEETFEIEFVDNDGATKALLPLSEENIARMKNV